MVIVSKETTSYCIESDSEFLTIWKLIILQIGIFATVVKQIFFMLTQDSFVFPWNQKFELIAKLIDSAFIRTIGNTKFIAMKTEEKTITRN